MQSTVSQVLSFIISLGLYVGIMAYIFSCEADWTARQTWAVILTGAIIVWYTWETMQLRFAAHAQRETQLRPYIILKSEPGQLSVLNVGNGTALHICAQTVVINDELKIEVRFPKIISVLRPGETQKLEMQSYINGKDAKDIFNAHLDPQYSCLELPINIRFDNVELKTYSTTQTISPGKISVSAIS